MLPRKAPVELIAVATVPQTDTGGRGEYPKALERTLLKELSKLTPYLRKKVCLYYVTTLAVEAERGCRDQGVATVYQKHSTLLSRKTTYRV